MNFRELYSCDSGGQSSGVSVLKKSLGLALMSCLVSCTTRMKTLPDSAGPLAFSYQNVHNLGEKLLTPSTGDTFHEEFEALARLLFPENSPKGSDTVVDDDGNIFTREQLEPRDK